MTHQEVPLFCRECGKLLPVDAASWRENCGNACNARRYRRELRTLAGVGREVRSLARRDSEVRTLLSSRGVTL